MKMLMVFSVLLLSILSIIFSQPSVTIGYPWPYRPVTGDSVNISATVNTTYAVDSIVCALSGSKFPLIISGSSNTLFFYEATISTANLINGVKKIKVYVKTASGETCQDSSEFCMVKIKPPVVSLPHNDSILPPLVHIRILPQDSAPGCYPNIQYRMYMRSTDDTTCQSGKFISYINSIDTILDLTIYNHHRVFCLLSSIVNDSAVHNLKFFFYVESSNLLVPYKIFDNKIVDFDGSRILTSDSLNNLHINSITTDRDVIIPSLGNQKSIIFAKLTEYGAFYCRDNGDNWKFDGFEYSSDSTRYLGIINRTPNGNLQPIKIAGDYAAYIDSTNLKRVKISTGLSQQILPFYGTSGPQIGDFNINANGTVLYTNYFQSLNKGLFKWNSGSEASFGHSDLTAFSPIIDSNYIFFTDFGSIHVYKDSLPVFSDKTYMGSARSPSNFQVNNGRIVYPAKGTMGQSVLNVYNYLRDTVYIITKFSQNCMLESINKNGFVSYIYQNQRIIADSNGTQLFKLPFTYGLPFWSNDTFMLAVNGTLYTLNVNAIFNATFLKVRYENKIPGLKQKSDQLVVTNIRKTSSPIKVQIYAGNGKLLLSQTLSNSSVLALNNTLSPGYYIYRLNYCKEVIYGKLTILKE